MRRPHERTLVAVLCLLVLSAPVWASPVEQGMRELSGSFSWATGSYSYEGEDLGSETALRFAPGLGYFMSDALEVRLQFPITFTSYDWEYFRSDYSVTTLGPQFSFLYHFGGSETFLPFVGAGAGASWASDSEDSEYDPVWVLPSAHVGFRSFLGANACLTTEFLYQHQVNAGYEEDISGNVFALTVGLSVFLQ